MSFDVPSPSSFVLKLEWVTFETIGMSVAGSGILHRIPNDRTNSSESRLLRLEVRDANYYNRLYTGDISVVLG